MKTYNSVFQIFENDVRLKETPFNFVPLTYKRGRKIGLTLGDLVTDFLALFCQKSDEELTVLFFVFVFGIDIQV